MLKNRRDFKLALFLVSLSSLIFAIAPQIRGNAVSLTLFGDGMVGWGLTADTIASPGPTIGVDFGDEVTLTLVSADGVLHDFGVDYNGNGNADLGEPLSGYFGGNYSLTLSYTFTVSALPGTYI